MPLALFDRLEKYSLYKIFRMRQFLLIALYNFNFGIILYVFVLIAYWYFTIFYWQPVQYIVDVSFSTDTHWKWIRTVAETCRRAVYLLKLVQFVGWFVVFQWNSLFFLLNNRSHDHIAAYSDVCTGRVVISRYHCSDSNCFSTRCWRLTTIPFTALHQWWVTCDLHPGRKDNYVVSLRVYQQ